MNKTYRTVGYPLKKIRTAIRVIRDQPTDLLPLLTRSFRPHEGEAIRALAAEALECWITDSARALDDGDPQSLSVPETDALKISVIIVTDSIRRTGLGKTLESLRWQTTPQWEAFVCAVGSSGTRGRAGFTHRLWHDPRIVHVNGFSRSRGAALHQATLRATGAFVAVVDAGDILTPGALASVLHRIYKYPAALIIYGDESCRGADGRVFRQVKPKWSPELLANYNYFGHSAVLNRDALLKLGGYADDMGDAAEWDMALRLTHELFTKASSKSLQYVPTVICHRPTKIDASLPNAFDPQSAFFRMAAEKHWLRQGVIAHIESCVDGALRATWDITPPSTVSIILADRYDIANLRTLCDDLNHRTDYKNLEIIIVNRGEMDFDHLSVFQSVIDAGGLIVQSSEDTTYFRACNLGAARAQGELLLFLRSDLEIGASDWLSELVRHAARAGVGIVGPELLERSVWIGQSITETEPADVPELRLTRNVLAVAESSQMMRREVFDRAAGYDESFVDYHGGVALSLFVWRQGYRNVCSPHSRLRYRKTLPYTIGAADGARLISVIDAFGVAGDPYFQTESGQSAMFSVEPSRLAMDAGISTQSSLDAIPGLGSDKEMAEAIKRPFADLWSATDANGPIRGTFAAARFVIDILRRRNDVQLRFPRAISDGKKGSFFHWLATDQGPFKHDAETRSAIADAFDADLSKRGRQVAFYNDALRTSEHLFLLPQGRRPLALVLFDAQASGLLRLEEVWWTLLESAERPESELIQTWLFMPEWQAKFPDGLNAAGRVQVSRWLNGRYGMDWEWLDAIGWPLQATHASAAVETQKLSPNAHVEHTAAVAGVNVLAHFSYPSGLRSSAEYLVESLKVCGVPSSLRNVHVSLSWDEPNFEQYSGGELFNTSIIHVQPEPFFPQAFIRAGLLERYPATYRIGYWYWESEEIPESWDAAARHCDEIWTATHFVGAALRSRYSKPVHVLPPGIEIPSITLLPRSHFEISQKAFVFLFVFHMTSSMDRKNPLDLITAFRAAFAMHEEVALVLKTTFGWDHPEQLATLREAAAADTRIRVIDVVSNRAETLSLMAAADCYVSLHRSEGLGLTMIEAMLLGKPVIATSYSGNMDFMNETNSLLVDHNMVSLETNLPNYPRGLKWAQPSIEHAAMHMKFVYKNREEAIRLGLRGKADLELTMNYRVAGSAMLARLAQL